MKWYVGGAYQAVNFCVIQFAMAKDDPQFNLRMPLALRRKVAAAAKENNRSVTAEINSRLESTFHEEIPNSEMNAIRDIIDRANFLARRLKS